MLLGRRFTQWPVANFGKVVTKSELLVDSKSSRSRQWYKEVKVLRLKMPCRQKLFLSCSSHAALFFNVFLVHQVHQLGHTDSHLKTFWQLLTSFQLNPALRPASTAKGWTVTRSVSVVSTRSLYSGVKLRIYCLNLFNSFNTWALVSTLILTLLCPYFSPD